MCGIAGFSGEDEARIRRMTEALVHRGPDGNAVCVGHGASLGHARLAILDPRPVGDQPMWNSDRTIVIVFNGEIFNFKELAKRYGLACRTNTDTEVLLKLYERKGMEFVPELLGMFALAIYDTRDRSWHLARDSAGIKPLYVHVENGALAFASEMRSLIAGMASKPALNMTSLALFLRLQYVPGPQTMCVGIESVPPGTVLTFHDGTETRKIVMPALGQIDPAQAARPAQRDLTETIDSVVADHLISDRPVGLFLSGGMDSSVTLHHMRNHVGGELKTFTVRFDATKEEGGERFNADAELASKTAKHYGTDHHEVFLSAEACREIYGHAARGLDQPNADAVSSAMYLLSREAKKHVDVVLTGAGGDELFGGYPRYRVARVLHDLRGVPSFLRGLMGTVTGHPPDVLRMSPGPQLAVRLLARTDAEWRPLTRGGWYADGSVEALFMERYPQDEGDPVRAFMEFDRALWLVDESLRLTDGLTMAHGLEARVPLLDPRLIDLTARIPSRSHVTWRRTKALLKETYRGILPDHLFTLPKASFYPPLAKWLRRECAPLVDEALENPWIGDLFNKEELRRLQREHSSGGYHLHVLSAIIQLHFWHRHVYSAH